MVWCEFGADHKCTGKAWEIRTWNVWEDEGKEWARVSYLLTLGRVIVYYIYNSGAGEGGSCG